MLKNGTFEVSVTTVNCVILGGAEMAIDQNFYGQIWLETEMAI